MKILKGVCFASLFLALSISVFAQTDTDETQKVKERAEKLLQTIREEKWDETYKFVAIVVYYKNKITKKRMDIPGNADEATKMQIAETFKKLYIAPKPEKIIRIKLNEKDKTLAKVEYMHEDLDGFNMVLIDDKWFYAMEIYID